ncbi:hypothetical protein NDU88_005539 [Pleurodeles waltl]|uniref:Uncharacterized protein n=1 Tax=Pleurodeles waltl TaxID=8319 RepID=A0AAV7WAY6_PLEWA|nr:hypothetical protein NDU88_005539 [Pleurodeles waltl]
MGAWLSRPAWWPCLVELRGLPANQVILPDHAAPEDPAGRGSVEGVRDAKGSLPTRGGGQQNRRDAPVMGPSDLKMAGAA